MELLLISHGKFSYGIKESYDMIVGENDKIHSLSLDDEGMEEFSKKLNSTLKELTSNGKVLVFTDIQGGTPYNQALRFKLENPDAIEIVSGMNLPMVVEAGMNLDSDISCEELAEMSKNTGEKSIITTKLNN